MLRQHSFIAYWSLLLAVGCLGCETATEVEWPSCGDRSTEMQVDAHTETVQGTAAALVERTTVEQIVALRYARDVGGQSVSASTTATLSVTPDLSSARLVQRKDHTNKQLVCEPSLELDAVVRIESEDGAFDERLYGTLEAYQQGPFVSAELPFAELKGRYTTDPAFAKGVLHAHLSLRDDLADASDKPVWTGNLTLDNSTRSGSAEVAWW